MGLELDTGHHQLHSNYLSETWSNHDYHGQQRISSQNVKEEECRSQVCIMHKPHIRSITLFGQACFTPARFAEYQVFKNCIPWLSWLSWFPRYTGNCSILMKRGRFFCLWLGLFYLRLVFVAYGNCFFFFHWVCFRFGLIFACGGIACSGIGFGLFCLRFPPSGNWI